MAKSKKLRWISGLFIKHWGVVSISKYVKNVGLLPRVIFEKQPISIGSPLFLGGSFDVDSPNDPDFFPQVSVVRLKSILTTGASVLMGVNNRIILHHDLMSTRFHLTSEELSGRIFFDAEGLSARWSSWYWDEQPANLSKAAIFTDAVSVNYAHWLTEVLPRIVSFAQCNEFADVPILMDAGLHANMYRSLTLALPTARDLYLLPKDRRVNVDDAYCVSPTGYIPFEPRGGKVPGHSHGIFSVAAIKLMVDSINRGLSVSPRGKQGGLIYVKRNSNIRLLRNTSEIEAILVNAGFDIIEPERMSFDDQVRAFRSADVIVGATGAGMANLLFAHSSCKIYILMAEHPDMPYYYWQRMADCVDLQISYLLGVQVDDLSRGVHADFEVPIERVHLMLNEMGLSANKSNETII